MNCRQLVEILDKLAPPELAEKWDNTGLSYGDLDREISKVMVALEPSEVVINQAIEKSVDVLITHHPMIFKSVDNLSYDTLIGRKITKLAKNDIVTFSMHTNMDIAIMARKVAEIFELEDVNILEVTDVRNIEGEDVEVGLGCTGYLKQQMEFSKCVHFVKEKLNIESVRTVGNKANVHKIAILPGSGKSFIKNALHNNVDLLITGDMDYHSAVDANDMGLTIIDAGHFETEYFFVDYVSEYLKDIFNNMKCTNISVEKAIEVSPLVYN